jgi:hypothetical protein
MKYSYVGNIPLQEYIPHCYIMFMAGSPNNINEIRGLLKTIFQKAGYKPKDAAAGNNSMLKIPGLGKVLDIRWKSQVNNAVLSTLANTAGKSSRNVTVIATGTLARALFERCRDKGLPVIDSHGNGCIHIPGFWYEHFVAPEQKKRVPVAGTPFPKKASRLVRAFLVEPSRKWSRADLIKVTGLSQGYVSKCLELLFKEGYIGDSGDFIQLREPDRLLDDWTSYYRFDRHAPFRYAFSYSNYENGLEKLGKALAEDGILYAYTGWSGAYLRAAYTIPTNIMVYVSKIPENPEQLGLYTVGHGENCILIEPQDEGVLQFSQEINGMKVVCNPQLYLDLRRMPGRALDQAEVIRRKFLHWEPTEYE